jgi:membrane protease YdiL (CAAX protease family)
VNFTPGVADYLILGGLLSAMTYELIFPKLKQRTIAYAGNIALLWTLTFAVVALWLLTGRQWGLLFLGRVVWWRLAIGFVPFFALLWLALRNRRIAKANPKALAPFEQGLKPIEWMMPLTAMHMRWWTAVSITAGITEEVLIRGFLVALIAYFTGLAPAVIVAAMIFGMGHAYQQWKNAIPTGLYGLGLNIIVLISGSLVPAMAIHIAQDYFTGELAYFALKGRGKPHPAHIA